MGLCKHAEISQVAEWFAVCHLLKFYELKTCLFIFISPEWQEGEGEHFPALIISPNPAVVRTRPGQPQKLRTQPGSPLWGTSYAAFQGAHQ